MPVIACFNLEEFCFMGKPSLHGRYVLLIVVLAALTVAGPLACTSPIPSHFTLRTAPDVTATETPTVEPTPTVTEAVTVTDTPATQPISSTQTPLPDVTSVMPTDTSQPVPSTLTPTRAPTRTPTLTPTPGSPLPQGQVHYDAESGFALMLPDGWQAVKDKGITFMANQPAVWESSAPNDPLVMVMVGPIGDLFGGAVAKARTPEEVLMIGAGTLSKDWQVEVGSVKDAEVKGYPAAECLIQDGNDKRTPQLAGRCLVVLADNRAAVIWALSPTDQWAEFAPTFQAMLRSLTFAEPVKLAQAGRTPSGPTPVAPGSGTPKPPTPRPTIKKPPAVAAAPPVKPFPAVEDPYTNDVEKYSLKVPKGWRVMVEEGTLTIASSADDFSLPVPQGPMVEVTVGALSSLWEGAAKGSTDPGPLLEVAVKVQAERGIDYLGQAKPIQIDGHPALTVDLAGAGLKGRLLSVYLGPDRAGLMGVLAPEGQWAAFAPVFQSMVDSLKFSG